MAPEVGLRDALAVAASRADAVEWLVGMVEQLNVRMGQAASSGGARECAALQQEESCLLVCLGDVVSFMREDISRALGGRG